MSSKDTTITNVDNDYTDQKIYRYQKFLSVFMLSLLCGQRLQVLSQMTVQNIKEYNGIFVYESTMVEKRVRYINRLVFHKFSYHHSFSSMISEKHVRPEKRVRNDLVIL